MEVVSAGVEGAWHDQVRTWVYSRIALTKQVFIQSQKAGYPESRARTHTADLFMPLK